MTKVFTELSFSNPVRERSQEIVLMLDAESKVILDYKQMYNENATNQVKKYKMQGDHLKKQSN